MGKFSYIPRLSKKEQEDLFIRFVQSIASLRSSIEAASLVKDLLSEPEALMLARRLQIADLLNQGLTYRQIQKLTRASANTIAKVQTWLKLYGDGYRTVLKRTQEKNKPENLGPLSWSSIKKRYPMHFWPEMFLKEIVRSANKKEKRRLNEILVELKEKTGLSKQLQDILKSDKNYNTL